MTRVPLGRVPVVGEAMYTSVVRTALASCYVVVVATSSASDDTRLSGNDASAERNTRYVRRYQDERPSESGPGRRAMRVL
jgi:hypothetical protein